MECSVGSQVLFITKHGETPYSGRVATVLDDRTSDGFDSWRCITIKFEDGFCLHTTEDEIHPVPSGIFFIVDAELKERGPMLRGPFGTYDEAAEHLRRNGWVPETIVGKPEGWRYVYEAPFRQKAHIVRLLLGSNELAKLRALLEVANKSDILNQIEVDPRGTNVQVVRV